MERTTTPPGEFVSEWQATPRACRYCAQSGPVRYRIWESACGGYVDELFRCGTCRNIWWVDGIDA